MASADLSEAFSDENIARAWLWTRTNPNPEYKQYFRHIYRAYAISTPQSLRNLRGRLRNETFEASYATKIYFPKKSGILRPYSLLSIEDQIVYQSLVNVVAERLRRRVRGRYNSTVFGSLYGGKRSLFFYQDWRKGYRAFSDSIRTAVQKGFIYSASFDLTACFDSIDHKVLSHFLSHDLNLDIEFVEFLTRCLGRWTVALNEKPIYIGHGIPQGPLPSGLLAEVVLKHFDEDKRSTRKLRYFRYVDDIRLFSKSEKLLRQELIQLDRLSKEIGLFPQSGKIDIHRVTNINEEIKGISHPPEWEARAYDPDQVKIRARLIELTPKFKVKNETRFKYVLGRASPSSTLTKRLLRIVEGHPHLYRSIFGYLTRSPKLSSNVSEKCVGLLASNDLYAAFSSSLIRSIRDNLHEDCLTELHRYCRSRLTDRTMTNDPELRAASAGVLLRAGKLTWPQTEFNLYWKQSWWTRSAIIQDVNSTFVGGPSFEHLMNKLLRDESPDVAAVAAEQILVNDLNLSGKLSGINIIAQHSLRNGGKIGRVAEGTCKISQYMISVLGGGISKVQWKKIFGTSYDDGLSKTVRWAAYSQTDASAWVNLTDIINDMILNQLFQHDGTIGSYQLGNIGSVLQPNSKFAKKFPAFYRSVGAVHKKRLESELSHPRVKTSGRPTRRIRFTETPKLKAVLLKGYNEIWRKW